jgi:hypothetical protein
MKRTIPGLLLAFSICLSGNGQSQVADTLVDVGGYRLHFHVIGGTGIPILFEAGGGDDGTAWDQILKPVADITGATVITYDRAGFGKSEIDDKEHTAEGHGILNGIKGLEIGLKKLGYDSDIMMVAHSYGGFYTTLYASRHPQLLKSAVLIDANLACWFTDAYTNKLMKDNQDENAKVKVDHPGRYYQFINLPRTVSIVRASPFPSTIPVIDVVSDHPPFDNETDIERWRACHREFAKAATNRDGFVAYGTGHYVYKDNPELAVIAIVKAYSNIVDPARRDEVLERSISYSLEAANETKRRETAFRHSEDDLNSWGYALLRQGDSQRALDVFKLNLELNPTNWNVYDSYGEALLKVGRREEAVAMYRKSIDVNPGNEHGKKVLEEILNSRSK